MNQEEIDRKAKENAEVIVKTASHVMWYVVAALAGVAIIGGIILFFVTKAREGESPNVQEVISQTEEGKLVTESELSATPSVEIQYGDYDGMKTFSTDTQNGRTVGQIVKIDGLVYHPGMSYSIVQESAEESSKIGTVFTIDDLEKADYPADGTRVEITAKVVEVDTLNYQLVTLEKFVKEVE